VPATGDTIWSDGGRVSPGRKGVNQVVAAAQDGARVAIVGAVGRDALVDLALAGVAEAGVDVRAIVHCDAATGRFAISVTPIC